MNKQKKINIYRKARKLRFLKYIPFAKSINNMIANKLRNNIDFPVETEVGMMYLDKLDTHHLSTNGIYDKDETELCRRLIKENDIVIDIGASIGYYTLLFSKLANKGKVYAFEPDPVEFEILKKNVELNKCSNVILENKAIADRTGNGALYFHENDRADGRIVNPNDNRSSIWIRLLKLDDLNISPDFTKIDVQGAEYLVLQGMENMVKNNSKTKIMIEFCPELLRKSGARPEYLIEILIKYGFTIYEIEGNGYAEKDLDYLLEIKGYTNLLCVKQRVIKETKE